MAAMVPDMPRRRRNAMIAYSILFMLMSLSCSRVTAAWYAKPEKQYLTHFPENQVDGARLETTDLTVEYWAKSNRYPTMTGPLLMPFIPDEPPVLNHEHITMNMRITVKNREPKSFKAKINYTEISLVSPNGTQILPDMVTLYAVGQENFTNIISTHSRQDMPKDFSITEKTLVELNFYVARFSEFSSFSMRVPVELDGKPTETKVVRFTSERDRDYHPFIFPFAYAGVR